MVKNKIIGSIFALLVLLVLGVTSVTAYSPNMFMPMHNTHEQQFMMTGNMHEDINSGRNFGLHVREHNEMFSGTMNPGVHHRGYSGLMN